jgi:predicted Zn finger-like uncharacterized protein
VWKNGGFPRLRASPPLLHCVVPPNALSDMIIACPACRTRYVVPDTAIGIDGRKVRCATCKHSWFQDGPELAAGEPAPQLAGEPAPAAAPSAEPAPKPAPSAEHAPAQPEAAGEVEQREPEQPQPPPPQPSVNFWRTPQPVEEAAQPEPEVKVRSPEEPAAVEDAAQPALVEAESASTEPANFIEEQESGYSRFGYEPPFRARRNPLRLWTAAALLFAVSVFGAIVAINIWGMPSWLPFERPVFGMEKPGLQLDFPPEQQDKQTLPNGTEYLEVSGSITNTGRTTASVPSIMIALRNEQDQIVYTWEIVPPQRELAPGATMRISEAMVDVPRSARVIEIGWSP